MPRIPDKIGESGQGNGWRDKAHFMRHSVGIFGYKIQAAMKYIIWDYNRGRYIRREYKHETSARNAIRGFARRDVKRRKHTDLITAQESYMVEQTPGKDA